MHAVVVAEVNAPAELIARHPDTVVRVQVGLLIFECPPEAFDASAVDRSVLALQRTETFGGLVY